MASHTDHRSTQTEAQTTSNIHANTKSTNSLMLFSSLSDQDKSPLVENLLAYTDMYTV